MALFVHPSRIIRARIGHLFLQPWSVTGQTLSPCGSPCTARSRCSPGTRPIPSHVTQMLLDTLIEHKE
jgi:hypothetical protein